MSKAQAENLARQILEEGGYTVPIDVFAIASKYGISVSSLELEDSVSGMLVIRGNRAIIGVNSTNHPRRQRFTIAHELAHYLLHRDKSDLFVDGASVYYRDEQSSKGIRFQEIDANAFAGELLMPRQALKQIIGAGSIHFFDEVSLEDMAAHFQVSVQAMMIRLERLGLLTA